MGGEVPEAEERCRKQAGPGEEECGEGGGDPTEPSASKHHGSQRCFREQGRGGPHR